jgi:hypothetical protein
MINTGTLRVAWTLF